MDLRVASGHAGLAPRVRRCVMLSRYSIGIVESVAMDESGADTPEQVLKFVPKERLRGYVPVGLSVRASSSDSAISER